MIIIAFEKENTYIGGYGDRIVGLISCKVISELLNKPFRISWTKEDVSQYLNYEKYKYINDDYTEINVHGLIDISLNPNHIIIKRLMTEPDIFSEGTHKFIINSDISQHIYKNPIYKNKCFLDDIYRIYKTLYTDILIPTELMKNKISSIITDDSIPIIGIQIRAGDCYINNIYSNSYKVIDDPNTTIYNILLSIKSHIIINKYKIFLTSDYNEIYTVALRIWDSDSLLYVNDIVKHMDRNPSGDFSKIFVDNYILSQKTTQMYISDYSNYGRIAALSSSHNNIFNLKCEYIDKSKLISKN